MKQERNAKPNQSPSLNHENHSSRQKSSPSLLVLLGALVNQIKRLLRKALPEPVFKYFSKVKA